MWALLTATLLSVTYSDVYDSVQTTGKPVLVVVSGPNCPWCDRLEQTSIAQLKREGIFRNSVFLLKYQISDPQVTAYTQHSGTRAIPQLFFFYKTDTMRWRRHAGYLPPENLRKFIEVPSGNVRSP